MQLNRLKNHRVHLAGAMDRVQDRGRGWRDDIIPFLESLGTRVWNPLDKPIGLFPEDDITHATKRRLKAEHNWTELSRIMKEIRGADLHLVDKSNFLVVDLDLDIHPCGTYEEIFWANRLKSPILIHIRQGKSNTPDWLFGTLPHQWFFSDWDSLKTYLTHINQDEVIDDLGRWRFFANEN